MTRLSSGWRGSQRREELPPNWHQLREAVKRRAGGQCEHLEDSLRCPNAGTDCDHALDRHDHRLSALQWLCADHHKMKTQREAIEGRRAAREAMRHSSAKTSHPGLT